MIGSKCLDLKHPQHSFKNYIYIYVRRGIFQDQWGVYLFIWALRGLLHMGYVGGVTIRDFPWGTPVPVSKFNKLSQRGL